MIGSLAAAPRCPTTTPSEEKHAEKAAQESRYPGEGRPLASQIPDRGSRGDRRRDGRIPCVHGRPGQEGREGRGEGAGGSRGGELDGRPEHAVAEHVAGEGYLPRVRARLRQEGERHDG